MGALGRNRTLLIVVMVLVGSVLAFAVTRYLQDHVDVEHHVSTGKVGTNPDGTVWIAEFIGDTKVLNYTLPYGSVHSQFIIKENIFIISVPEYTQNFNLVPDGSSESSYLVHIPEFEINVAFGEIDTAYWQRGQSTELNEVYDLLYYAFRDTRVRELIADEGFGINGIVTRIHKEPTYDKIGFILMVNDRHYLVRFDSSFYSVKEFREISFDTK
jgi:hypothetical protein